MNAKRILIIQPPHFRFLCSHNNRPNLGLFSLAEVLTRAGHDVRVLNMDFEDSDVYADWYSIWKNFPRLKKMNEVDECMVKIWSTLLASSQGDILKIDIAIIGFGDVVLPTVDFNTSATAIECARICKGYGVKTIGYGPLVRECPELDIVIQGEADDSIEMIIESGVTGIIKCTVPDSKFLEGIPFSNFYKFVNGNKADFDYIVSSRGCAHFCDFCLVPKVCNGKVRFPDEFRFLDELEYRIDKLGVTDFYFADMNFMAKRARADLICDELIDSKQKITWRCESRLSDLTYHDESCSFAMKMIKAGCKSVKIGIEGVQHTRASLGKDGYKLADRQIFEKLSALKKVGLGVVVYVMIGGGGTEEDYLNALPWWKSLPVDSFVINVSYPYPGTKFYEKVSPPDFYGLECHLNQDAAKFWKVTDAVEAYFEVLCSQKPKEDSYARKFV